MTAPCEMCDKYRATWQVDIMTQDGDILHEVHICPKCVRASEVSTNQCLPDSWKPLVPAHKTSKLERV